MKITEETKFSKRAVMFGDGKNGYFMQAYTLFADDIDTGVEILVTGNLGKNNTKQVFTAKDQAGEDVEFEDYKEALRFAGHDLG